MQPSENVPSNLSGSTPPVGPGPRRRQSSGKQLARALMITILGVLFLIALGALVGDDKSKTGNTAPGQSTNTADTVQQSQK